MKKQNKINSVNINTSNLQLNKLKSSAKDAGNVTLRLSSCVICNTADETNIPNKSLLTDSQASKVWKDYTYDLSANMNSSKTHISKTKQYKFLIF